MKIESLEKQIANLLVIQRMDELHGKLFKILIKITKGYDNHKIYKALRKGYNQPAVRVWWYEQWLIKRFGTKEN